MLLRLILPELPTAERCYLIRTASLHTKPLRNFNLLVNPRLLRPSTTVLRSLTYQIVSLLIARQVMRSQTSISPCFTQVFRLLLPTKRQTLAASRNTSHSGKKRTSVASSFFTKPTLVPDCLL